MKSLQRSRLAIVLAGWLLVDCSSGAASPPSRDAVMVGGPGDAQTPPTSSAAAIKARLAKGLYKSWQAERASLRLLITRRS